MANDLFDSLRTYINKVSVNEKSAAEIANSVNAWVRESGEAVKQKIEEEVESTVLRMGFVKRGKPVATKSANKASAKKSAAPKKATAKKATAKKATAKKPVAKKSATKKSAVKKSATKKVSK